MPNEQRKQWGRKALLTTLLTVVATTTTPNKATAQQAGPNILSAIELGISNTEAIVLERQWDALDRQTRTRIRCAGTRNLCRTWIEGLRVFRTRIGPGIRTAGPRAVSDFLRGKDWSHIVPRSMGGSDLASNGRWEQARLNRTRGARVMTAREIAAAERAANSPALRTRFRTIARRGVGGGALGAVVAGTIGIMNYGLQLYRGEITEEEFRARVVATLAEDVAIGIAIGALATVGVAEFPVLAPILATVAMVIGTEMLARYGDDARNVVEEVARTFSESNWSVAAVRRKLIELTHEPITARNLYSAYNTSEWPTPKPHKTATSKTLYAPPFADPEEVLNFVHEQLRR